MSNLAAYEKDLATAVASSEALTAAVNILTESLKLVTDASAAEAAQKQIAGMQELISKQGVIADELKKKIAKERAESLSSVFESAISEIKTAMSLAVETIHSQFPLLTEQKVPYNIIVKVSYIDNGPAVVDIETKAKGLGKGGKRASNGKNPAIRAVHDTFWQAFKSDKITSGNQLIESWYPGSNGRAGWVTNLKNAILSKKAQNKPLNDNEVAFVNLACDCQAHKTLKKAFTPVVS